MGAFHAVCQDSSWPEWVPAAARASTKLLLPFTYCRRKGAGILFTETSGFWGCFLTHPSQRYWSVCPAMSRGVLAEQVCSVQHSSVPELRGRLGHPAGAGSGLWLSAGGAMGPAVCTSLCPAAPRAVSATDLSSPPLVCLSVPTSRLERLQDVRWQRRLRGVGHPLLTGSLL